MVDDKLDYIKLGLKCGIEVHQQLEGRKLFCNCPTEIIDEKQVQPDLKIKRNLRASAGETGEIDAAAKQEQLKEKHYLYYFYKKSCCLVELDEEPPHNVNKEALETGLIVSKMLKAKVVDEIHFMRKIVVDGSNTSGFQRTGLIAMYGHLEIKDYSDHTEKKMKKINVPSICLEEDASRIVEKTSDIDIYNLTKLGIPLVEIATDPDINFPEEAKECAERLGMILRSTGKVKRGIGTIRQDVNVSIKGGNRVELKGVQDLKMVPTLVDNEIKRQICLIELKDKINKSMLNKIKNEKVDLTPVLKKSESKLIKSTLSNNGVIYGLKLTGLKGFLGKETMPGRRVGSELSDYAKIKAGVGGLFHSDEFYVDENGTEKIVSKYGITEKELLAVCKKLECKPKDAFVLIADKEQKVIKALDAVYERVLLIEQGVIKEVRMPKADGTTSFMRPMPGAARMYPETDVKETIVSKEYINDLKIPELIADKASRIKDYGLSKDLAELLAKKQKVEAFEKFVEKFCDKDKLKEKALRPAFIAETMLPKLLYMKRKHNLDDKELALLEDESNQEKVFEAVSMAGTGVVEDVLLELAKSGKINLSEYCGMKQISDKDIEKEIKAIVDKNKGTSFGALMGMVMVKFKGKIDGKKVNEILKKYI
ncbi:MAG: Glu-tRNA(Gln) amidotransferase subunit GatE [Candidatus Woesearchaeota archaeon]